MDTNSNRHNPVLCNEVVHHLAIRSDGIYLDGTFGRGGHAFAILSKLTGKGRLLGLDRDPDAIFSGKKLEKRDSRFSIIQCNFSEIFQEVSEKNLTGKIDGIVLDLGVSSPQLDNSVRGFSFSKDGPLDMRADPYNGMTAAEFINTASQEKISNIFKVYGEERFAKRLAAAVIKRRKLKSFRTTLDLANVLKIAHPSWEKNKHPATRAFQALRIHINNELENLTYALEASYQVLGIGGRLVVISFHSLEDRIVKLFMRRLAKGKLDSLPRRLPIKHIPFSAKIKIHGKPKFPSKEEIILNPRSRSAVMRIAEKLS